MATLQHYPMAVSLADKLPFQPPLDVLEDIERYGGQNGISADALVEDWPRLPGAPDSPEANMRAVAERLATIMDAGRRERANGIPRRPVTGVRQGYVTWRTSRRRALLVLPVLTGIILERREFSFDQSVWPLRSIQEIDPNLAADWNDRFVSRVPRAQRLRFLGFRAGNWSNTPSLGGVAVAGSVSGRYVLVPYWFLVFTCALLPAHALFRVVRAGLRRARGCCPHCSYDLRASPRQCPECGRQVRA